MRRLIDSLNKDKLRLLIPYAFERNEDIPLWIRAMLKMHNAKKVGDTAGGKPIFLMNGYYAVVHKEQSTASNLPQGKVSYHKNMRELNEFDKW